MTTADVYLIKQEWVQFLRNSDIFTTTQRSVTTAQDTGTFSSDSSYLIDHADVKNIRSIIVDGSTLSYGSDYNIDFYFDDSGTYKAKITFTNAQTGNYEINYDYGSDKIFPDFPKSSLKTSSFPRIGADIISMPSELFDMDGQLITTVNITTVVYDKQIESINDYISSITSSLNTNKKNFYYIGKFVRKLAVGPVLQFQSEQSGNKIFQQNIDIQGILNFEN